MAPTNGVASASSASTEANGAKVSRRSAKLPLHLTEKILCCISPLESARLATVCKSWATTISARLVALVLHLYVCMPPERSDRRGLVVSVALDVARFSPATNPARVHSSDTNRFRFRCIGATPSGRLAFAATWWSKDFVLVNPITGVRQSIDVGVSPLPRRVLVAGDSLFAVEGNGLDLILWRQAPGSGEERSWSRTRCALHQHPIKPILSAVNCNGCYYLLHVDGSLSTVDATAPPPLRMEKLPVARPMDPLGAFFVNTHLVESDGEVLLVQQLVTFTDGKSLPTGGFEVHRLDVKEQRWTKVRELPDDRALFVSPRSSFAVRVSNTAGCRSNYIYFVGEKGYYSNPACRQGHGSSWGLYSMADRRVLFEHAVEGPGTEAMWFLPRVV
ncbi:hypothetical protein EJB05_24384, partial [Eragrostis curvula]